MKKSLLASIYLIGIALLFTSCASVATEEEAAAQTPRITDEVPRITKEKLLQDMESGADILVVDVRGRASYEQAHIKGTISAPESVINDGQWEPPHDKAVVLY